MDEVSLQKIQNRRVHMANERTFLAWIRTSVAIMAFGFVIEKFALFMQQFSTALHQAGIALHATQHPLSPYANFFGIAPVVLGAAIGLLAFIRFKNVQRDIECERYRPALWVNGLLTLAMLALGAFLILYLAHSVS